jgi:hypothetical protein
MGLNVASLTDSLLNSPTISRIRRNHALEHATLHILAQRFPGKSMAGHSNPRGFWILGDIPPEEVRAAVESALARLRAGESRLALHPNCGTNLAVAGIAAGLSAWLAMLGTGNSRRDKLERLPLALSLATFGLIAAQPLGAILQARVTTCADPGDLRLVDVIPKEGGRLKAHRVVTEG